MYIPFIAYADFWSLLLILKLAAWPLPVIVFRTIGSVDPPNCEVPKTPVPNKEGSKIFVIFVSVGWGILLSS